MGKKYQLDPALVKGSISTGRLHTEGPLKPESSVCHRSSPVPARGQSVYYTVHSHSGIYQPTSSHFHYTQE